MKIISFGDIHENIDNLDKLKDELETADLVVISGDITNYHGKDEVERIIKSVKQFNGNILAQIGNLDRREADVYLSSENINLHGNGFMFGDVGIFGVGGSNETPFNTPSEYSEEEIWKFLSDGYEKVKEAKIKIMTPHAPPKDSDVDAVAPGVHAGSESVRKFIEEYKPDVCICGHIHEGRGKCLIGNTMVLNAGMFKNGWYIKVEYDGTKIDADVIKIVA